MKTVQSFGPSVRGRRRSIQRFVSWLLGLLCLLAAGLMILHLRPDLSGPAYYLRAPHGVSRSVSSLTPHQPNEDAVHVNAAGVDELITIPGVGPVLAQAIIDERLQHGFFYYPEDLLCVKGIGEKTLQKLLPYMNLE